MQYYVQLRVGIQVFFEEQHLLFGVSATGLWTVKLVGGVTVLRAVAVVGAVVVRACYHALSSPRSSSTKSFIVTMPTGFSRPM
jgi:hypothetical protein